ncbi:MAG TPA: hypothetical protein ENJ60_07970 [Aeromonadales bacterium]|nr:hypothetical protein [Aeromonadales bacterium]
MGMNIALKNIAASFLLMVLLSSCGGGGSSTTPPAGNQPPPTTVVAKGDRIMEIDLTLPADEDFISAFNKGRDVGMESISVSLDWTVIEVGLNQNTNPPTPIYETDPANDFLAIINGCYPPSNMKATLTLRPVITLVKNTPPDLENLPLDDPAVIARFKQLIDHVISKLPDLDLAALVIGSEVDLYLQTDTLKAEYLNFYEQISDYARTQYTAAYPNKSPIKIAVESTFEGLSDASSKAYFQQLNQFSDVIGVSYYPMDGNGQARPVSTVETDFQSLIASYPDKQLYFFQLGYPSGYYSADYYPEVRAGMASAQIGSSDIQQADFISAVFTAWDKHINAIGFIDFTWLHDLSEADVAATTIDPAFGGTANPDPKFVEFLRTVGLRTNDGANSTDANGSDKMAYTRLKTEAQKRSWPVSQTPFSCN